MTLLVDYCANTREDGKLISKILTQHYLAILLTDMFNLEMKYSINPTNLNIGNVSSFLVGCSSDDRGDLSTQLKLQSSKIKVSSMQYTANQLSYNIDDETFSVDTLDPISNLISQGSLLMDATTLGFVEICLCIRALKEIGKGELTLLYAEPKVYNQSTRSRGVLHNRDFTLSDRAMAFTAIPGSVILLNRQAGSKAVIMVGYEGDRLQQFIEQNGLSGEDCSVVYGVPAFYPGWESNAFSNTVRELDERRINSVLFAGATNPLAAYDAVRQIHETLKMDERLIIAPIGTKPHGYPSNEAPSLGS